MALPEKFSVRPKNNGFVAAPPASVLSANDSSLVATEYRTYRKATILPMVS